MGLTRADLLNPNETEQNKKEIQAWIDRASSNDEWANKIFKKVGVILTSHPGNRPYLHKSVECHSKLGFWICLAYDNYLHPDEKEIDYNKIMPSKDTMDMVDTFIMPHYQVWGGVLYPYFWLMKWAVALMKDFEYIYCTNGDFILEKPEGFHDLLVSMGEADIMTCGHNSKEGERSYANTAGFIVKTSAMIDIMKHYQDHFIPFDVYEKYTQEIGNAEGRFGTAIKDLGLKVAEVDPPNDDMLKVPGKGTWYEKLGFRHIHSEHNHAYRSKGIPPHYKWLDERHMGDEYNIIKKYWDTQDIKVLEGWWAKD